MEAVLPRRRIVVFEGADGQFYFRVIGDNDEQIGQSEGYLQKHDLLDTVEKYYEGWKIFTDHDEEIIRG